MQDQNVTSTCWSSPVNKDELHSPLPNEHLRPVEDVREGVGFAATASTPVRDSTKGRPCPKRRCTAECPCAPFITQCAFWEVRELAEAFEEKLRRLQSGWKK